jgi:DNA polymerase-3 subunit alpha
MEKFGGYGFNKSHSAAYALIAFQTAYLKAHFPVEFMAALLSSEMNSIDGVVKYIVECRLHAIEVLPPDINESNTTFTVNGSKIRFGLVAVKNVGEAAIEQIIRDREKAGPFSSLFEFCERVDLRKVNKRVVESLINCGAFDSTGSFRSQMMASLEDALEYGQRIQREKNDPQMGLFDMGGANGQLINMPSMPDIAEWGGKELLDAEKESLGFYISGHPLDRYQDLVEKFASVNALTAGEASDGAAVRIAGTISSIKSIRTKKGDLMAFLSIEDLHGMVEIVVFPRVYETAENYLKDDAPVFVQGQIQKDENTVKILAETVIPIEKAESIWSASINITIDTSRVDSETLSTLHDVLRKYTGSCTTFIHMQIPGKSETIIAMPDALKLRISPVMNREVNGLLGYGAVETTCSEIKGIPPKKHRF